MSRWMRVTLRRSAVIGLMVAGIATGSASLAASSSDPPDPCCAAVTEPEP